MTTPVDLLLASTDSQLLRARCAALLGRFGISALEQLVPFAAHPDGEVRQAVSSLLSQLPYPETLARVRALLPRAGAAARDLQSLAVQLERDVLRGDLGVPAVRATQEFAGTAPSRPHAVVLTERTAPLSAGEPLPLGRTEKPVSLVVRLECLGCSETASVELPLSYHSMDDDRFAARELTYMTRTAWANCPRCTAAWEVRQQADVVEARADASRTFVWTGAGSLEGARLGGEAP